MGGDMRRPGTLTYATQRILGSLGVLLVVLVVTYLIFYLLPTNPAQLICGKPCTPSNLAAAKAFLGVDQPWYVQLGQYLQGIVVGRSFGSGQAIIHCTAPCFGYSFHLNESVTELIAARLPVTISLAVGAAVLWLIIGVASGTLAAVFHRTPIDRFVTIISVSGVSTPTYLIGLLFIYVFGFGLKILPAAGYVPLTQDPVGWFAHLVLPWTVLAFVSAAIYARMTRSSMLDQLRSDYVRTARAKGLSESRVVGVHALRNAIVPVVTMFGLDFGGLLGGAVITEKIFAIPGLGSLMLDSVGTLDESVIVGVTLFASVMIVLANLVVDLSYGFLTPRVSARNG